MKLNAAELQALDGATVDDVPDWRRAPPEGSMRAAAEVLVGAISQGHVHARLGIIPGFQIWNVPVGSERAAVERVAHLPWVEYVVEDQMGELAAPCSGGVPTDPAWVINNAQQWALRQVCLQNVWPSTSSCLGARIAVVDSGINYEHPDLVNNIEFNTGETYCDGIDNDANGYVDDYYGWTVDSPPPYSCANPYDCSVLCAGTNLPPDVPNSPCNYYNAFNPQDAYSSAFPLSGNQPGSHGTAVAAVIGASCNGLYQVGVCWEAKIVNIRAANDCSAVSVSGAALAFDYCKVRSVKVINCSWGFESDDPGLRDIFSKLGELGMLAVCAAGNNNRNIDDGAAVTSGNYPARYKLPHVLIVGASDDADQRASFSNWGSKYVDLFAPGVDIRRFASCDGNGTVACNPPIPSVDIFYGGTSFATPIVTGVAALVWSLSPTLSPEDIATLLKGNVDDIPALHGLCNTRGRLNAARSMGLPTCH